MEKFKFTLHELMTLMTIIISVTTAYVLLNSDVQVLKDNVRTVSIEVDEVKKSTEQIKIDQLRTSVLLNHLYGIDKHSSTTGEGQQLDGWYHELDNMLNSAMADRKK